MGCQLASFPMKYLDIPLGLCRLPSEVLQFLMDRIAKKLPTWKAAMLPKARRLVLVKFVLAAIPLHRLVVLSANKKTLRKVDKILRGFLWAGRVDAYRATTM